MNLRTLAWGLAGAGAATLVYGVLVEANKLVVERKTLRLPEWPGHLNGYKIALLADFHLRDEYSVDLGKRAVLAALAEAPDMVCLAGDFVGYWKLSSPWMLGEVLEPLTMMMGNVVAIPGNHDYWAGDASLLTPIFYELGFTYLRNEVWRKDGICWVGIDSENAGRAEARLAMPAEAGREPIVTLWHEPDMVDTLPDGSTLMLSGHSHGGQFRFPWGWAPMHTRNGKKYVGGFYADAPTPLYVSRGLGTTGPPSRFGCPPEISILTLTS